MTAVESGAAEQADRREPGADRTSARPPTGGVAPTFHWFRDRADALFLVATVSGLAVGAVLHLAGLAGAGHAVWAATTGAALAPAVWWVLDAARQRRLGVDVIAVLALVGTLVVGEYLAGAVIAVMLASGRTLEAWAAGRARRELRLLLDRLPRIAHRRDGDLIVDIPAETSPSATCWS